MAIRLIQFSQWIHGLRRCCVCSQPLSSDDKIITKTTSRGAGGNGKHIYYHVRCARIKNLIIPDIWWNRITKYTRHDILQNLDSVEPDEVEEFSQLNYSKLPENIKLLVDVYFMEIKK